MEWRQGTARLPHHRQVPCRGRRARVGRHHAGRHRAPDVPLDRGRHVEPRRGRAPRRPRHPATSHGSGWPMGGLNGAADREKCAVPGRSPVGTAHHDQGARTGRGAVRGDCGRGDVGSRPGRTRSELHHVEAQRPPRLPAARPRPLRGLRPCIRRHDLQRDARLCLRWQASRRMPSPAGESRREAGGGQGGTGFRCASGEGTQAPAWLEGPGARARDHALPEGGNHHGRGRGAA
jgi:hypothetical protein